MKVLKKSQNSRNRGFSYSFFLMKEGSGFRKPKNKWIRIRNTGPVHKLNRISIISTCAHVDRLTFYTLPRHWFLFPISSSYFLFWNWRFIRTFCFNYRENWRHSVLGHQTAPAEGGRTVPGWSGQYTQWRPVTWYCLQLLPSAVDPDWIRIQWGPWIRIRNPDPYPGGQK